MRRNLRRWIGLVGVALRRTATKATATAPRQTAVSVLGVAIAVALMLVVTATGLGLVAGTTVRGDAVDYWVVPEGAGASSMVVETESAQLGDVHEKTAELNADERVEYATPVGIAVLEASAGGTSEYVLGVGVIPAPSLDRVAGLPTAPLSAGDPYYAGGSYDGEWTGEAVLSAGAAERLNASANATLSVSGALSGGGGSAGASGNGAGARGTGDDAGDFRVTAVEEAAIESGLSGMPVMVVHLGELQAVTGAAGADSADQILVQSTAAGLVSSLEEQFPGTNAVTRGSFAAPQSVDSDLPLAMGLAALLVAVTVGALFVATTQGLQVEADGEQLAALSAIGFSRRARAGLLVVQALALTLVGGGLGIALAYAVTRITNWAAVRAIAPVPIADFPPLLVAYGLGVSAVIGVLVAPYLLAMERRTESVTEVIR